MSNLPYLEETPWQWFGAFQDDPTWGPLFDEIEHLILMWLWDSNIVRHFGDKHPNLVPYLQQIPWSDIALPSVVMAEILHGRCEFALKVSPSQTPLVQLKTVADATISITI